ncbi:MAG: CPBP family intramembrane glutamic endopeptidase [Paracoccaceae bacterium]|jgi:membrane protease YdiL (CAAX protease family)
MIRKLIDWKIFTLLLGVGVIGTVAVMPYALGMQANALAEVPFSLPMIILLSLAQTTVLLSVAIIVGLVASKRIGLRLPLITKFLAGQLSPTDIAAMMRIAVPAGLLAGAAIILGDWLGGYWADQQFPEAVAPIWQGTIASLYGGIVEEILLRLFLMSVIAWLLGLVFRADNGQPAPLAFWLAIIAAAVLFGLGHLPATSLLVDLTPYVIVRAIVLNGIGGIVFGWLFWKRGLETAMAAHFSTDILLQLIWPVALLIFQGF